MASGATGFSRYLRTLLVLGRVSNLPTVWSNCLAGWILAGGGSPSRLGWLCLGGTLLYIAGMYFNDAFDSTFDRQHRPERPIPSGAIGVTAVWQWGLLFLFGGLACLIPLGKGPAVLAVLLAATILLYDAVHKIFAFSPVIMAACRFLLVLLAASVGANGITGLTVWTAIVLAAYVIGLSFIAQKESTHIALRLWPVLFLLAPLLLAGIINTERFQKTGFLLALVLIGWLLRSLYFAFWAAHRNVGRCVSSLLAGIVLVDLLAVGPGAWWSVVIFGSFFLLALVFQQFVPAT
ncbi:MAG TPA: UbiA family prenyltransferase [Verrucomicrobiae bacterium]|nr:UbiA family prenyltransferase [Verrucomicrobiae bacterium]